MVDRSGRPVYLSVHLPGHPLANQAGRVPTHRLVLWVKLDGQNAPCHWCGKPLIWNKRGRYGLIADHIDGDTYYNVPENIVPSCRDCNGNRTTPSARIVCGWCGTEAIGRREGKFCSSRCSMYSRWEQARAAGRTRI